MAKHFKLARENVERVVDSELKRDRLLDKGFKLIGTFDPDEPVKGKGRGKSDDQTPNDPPKDPPAQ